MHCKSALAVAFVLLVAGNAAPFSFIGHQIVALRTLEAVQAHPEQYPPLLAKVASSPELTAYFLGGAVAPDIGAVRGQSPRIEYSTHYEHPGLWMKTIFTLASTEEERAWAYGWVVHFGADEHLHPWMDQQGLNYCDDATAHAVFEAALDTTAKEAYEAQGRYATRPVKHAERLLLAALAEVARTPSNRVGAYGEYLRATAQRCGPGPVISATSVVEPGVQGVAALALDEFDVASAVRIYNAGRASADAAARTAARAFVRVAEAAPSLPARLLGGALRKGLESGAPITLSELRLAGNAEIVGLYGFVGGPVQNAVAVAAAGDWAALDRNFDTGEAVNDPALAQSPQAGGADCSGTPFWADGNLVATTEATESGPLRFVLNAGLADGTNREMIFGSAVARAVGGATALYHDERRAHVASEVLLLLAQLPATGPGNAEKAAQAMLGQLGWGADKIGKAAKYIDAFRADYWASGTDGAALHNTLAQWLRKVSRRTTDGRALHDVNLKALGDAMAVAQATAMISDAAIGACLRTAVQADVALDRLDVLEKALAGAGDPAIGVALVDARRQLENGATFWGALLEELNSRQAEYAQMGATLALKAAMKAVGAKGTLGLVLVLETIVSDWKQHDTAQVSVMAATLEELLCRAAPAVKVPGESCELRAMAAMARFLYFDRMVKVTSVWQGMWVDLLSRGRPYADAKAYFAEQRRTYEAALVRERANTCWQIAAEASPSPGGCGGGVELALLLDSSGSMQENDPQGLRRDAATLLVERSAANTRFTVVDFDSTARVVVPHSVDHQAVRSAIAAIDADGSTSIAAALVTGLGSISQASGARAAVLFTDGRSTVLSPPGVPDERGATDEYVRAGVPVHVVGLGPGVNADFLTRLAAQTGGVYLQAPRASDLVAAFDLVVADLACEGTVSSQRGTIQKGETLELHLTVDSLIDRLAVRLTWQGSRLSLALRDPAGNAAGTDVASGPTYRVVAVDKPTPGEWMARIVGEEVGPGGEEFVLRAGGPSDLRLAMAPADAGDPSLLRLSSTGPSGLSVDRAWSSVQSPGGATVDGPEPTPRDATTWTVAVPVADAGVYTVTAGLAGTATGRGSWAREVTRTVVIGEGELPWRGSVTQVDGGLLTINRGEIHGVRPGMRVTLLGGPSSSGVGVVVAILPASSTVEVQELYGSAVATPGMPIELDRTQWMGDRQP